MKEYLALCLEGESTIKARKEMLDKKQKALREEIAELEKALIILIGNRIFTMMYFQENDRM